ncbi:MAG: PAS domain S-box protein [Candidatus Bathyarchaeota archaeon]|nr:PAS domain S-box protein [Candidatus Bathyarchaeota archaeon]
MFIGDEDIKTLTGLGVNGTQAKIFLTLIKAGTSTIREVAELSGVARPDTYRALSELQNMSLVKKIAATPTRYKPLPLSEAVSMLIGQREKENTLLQEKLRTLIKDYEKQQPEKEKMKGGEFILVPAGTASSSRLEKLIENAQKSILIMASQRKVTRFLEKYQVLLKDALERDVKIKIATETIKHNGINKKKLGFQQKANLEIRHLVVLPPATFFIFDGKEAILFATNQITKESQISVLSTNSSIVELTQNYFDTAWFSAAEPQSQTFKRDKRQFDFLVENMMIGFIYCRYILDKKGKIVDFKILQANETFEKITKFRRNEIIGQTASQIMPSLVVKTPAITQAYDQMLKTRKSQKLEHFFKKIGVWFSLSIYRPKRGYCVFLFEDINERKTTELQVLEEKNRAEQYLKVVSHIILALNTEGQITLINKKGCEVLGYEEEELLGEDWVEKCIPISERKNGAALIAEFSKNHVPQLHESLVITKKGQTRIFLWHNIPLKNQDGNLIGLLCSGTDVTEQRKAEKIILESEKKYCSFFKNSEVPVALIKADGTVLVANSQMCNILEKDETMLKKSGLSYLFEVNKELQDKLQVKNGATNVPIQFKRKDGSTFYGDVFLSVFEDIDIETKFIMAIKDVTKQKQIQEALKEKATLNQILLDAFPFIAMVVNSKTREIVIANKVAAKIGVSPGKLCYVAWKKRVKPCVGCLAPQLLETGKPQHQDIKINGVTWEVTWLSVNEQCFMHYAFPK